MLQQIPLPNVEFDTDEEIVQYLATQFAHATIFANSSVFALFHSLWYGFTKTNYFVPIVLQPTAIVCDNESCESALLQSIHFPSRMPPIGIYYAFNGPMLMICLVKKCPKCSKKYYSGHTHRITSNTMKNITTGMEIHQFICGIIWVECILNVTNRIIKYAMGTSS